MITRRSFISRSSAAAILIGARRHALAADRFDLVITGGRVVDPAAGLDAVRDVAISNGRIAAVAAKITGDAADTLDARGKIVTPGLLDIHTHVTGSEDGPRRVLADGVTGWIDAGSQGADRIADAVAVARSSPQPGRVLINI